MKQVKEPRSFKSSKRLQEITIILKLKRGVEYELNVPLKVFQGYLRIYHIESGITKPIGTGIVSFSQE